MRLGAAFWILFAVIPSTVAGESTYQYFRTGDAADAVTRPSGGMVLMGGGPDVDEAIEWMCRRSAHGDFLIIRATGADDYNSYVREICPAQNSVSTLVIPDRAAANDPFVEITLQNAEAIWIAGGDQSRYIENWAGTAVATELDKARGRDVPIGGTSAGMNVLTPFVYSAERPRGATSMEALSDPYSDRVTLASKFVARTGLPPVIGDPHFRNRDRMGRELAFLCRIYQESWSRQPRAIAIDGATALMVDRSGVAEVVGRGSVYFLEAPGAPEACSPGTPLTYVGVRVQRMSDGGIFDLNEWRGRQAARYAVSAIGGALLSTQASGDVY